MLFFAPGISAVATEDPELASEKGGPSTQAQPPSHRVIAPDLRFAGGLGGRRRDLPVLSRCASSLPKQTQFRVGGVRLQACDCLEEMVSRGSEPPLRLIDVGLTVKWWGPWGFGASKSSEAQPSVGGAAVLPSLQTVLALELRGKRRLPDVSESCPRLMSGPAGSSYQGPKDLQVLQGSISGFRILGGFGGNAPPRILSAARSLHVRGCLCHFLAPVCLKQMRRLAEADNSQL